MRLNGIMGQIAPQYERFDTAIAFVNSLGQMRGDCANFVSQCLVAGGLTMNSSLALLC